MRWLYDPAVCDGRPCCGECDECNAADREEEK